MYLYYAILNRIVDTPNVTDRPVRGLPGAEPCHERFTRLYIWLRFLGYLGGGPIPVPIDASPIRIINRLAPCGLRIPDRESSKGIRMHPSCCASDQIDDRQHRLFEFFQAIRHTEDFVLHLDLSRPALSLYFL